MLRVFLKNRNFDPDMLIRVMLIKKKRVVWDDFLEECNKNC